MKTRLMLGSIAGVALLIGVSASFAQGPRGMEGGKCPHASGSTTSGTCARLSFSGNMMSGAHKSFSGERKACPFASGSTTSGMCAKSLFSGAMMTGHIKPFNGSVLSGTVKKAATVKKTITKKAIKTTTKKTTK